jgi:hypothetical protein
LCATKRWCCGSGCPLSDRRAFLFLYSLADLAVPGCVKAKIKAGAVNIMERQHKEALALFEEQSALMLELVKKQSSAKLEAQSQRSEELVKLVQEQHSEVSASPHTSLTPTEEQDLVDVKAKCAKDRACIEEQETELLRVAEKDAAIMRAEKLDTQEEAFAKAKA